VRRLGRFARLLARNATQDLDSLTGLLSWEGFRTRIESWVRASEGNAMLSVLYGDIDRLHVINDLAGFSDGDRVITRCANAIRRALVGAESCACRLSGDRFTVFLPHMNLAQARQLAESVCREVISADSQKGSNHPVSMSWGVVTTNASELHLDHRIAEAEIACKTAKDRGRGRVEVFQDSDQSMVRRHDEIGLIGAVREALQNKRIVVFAQPITPLINHSLPTTYELLVRIIDGKGNLVEAADFMSAATRYQFFRRLTARCAARLRTAQQALFAGVRCTYRSTCRARHSRIRISSSGCWRPWPSTESTARAWCSKSPKPLPPPTCNRCSSSSAGSARTACVSRSMISARA
jgi:diguanylate cyclase (GGDEF)-like protein